MLTEGIETKREFLSALVDYLLRHQPEAADSNVLCSIFDRSLASNGKFRTISDSSSLYDALEPDRVEKRILDYGPASQP
jgi:hypothetical protein